MTIFSNTIINNTKKTADATFGNLTKNTKSLLEIFDPQNKNIFEIMLYPASISTDPSSIATAALDSIISKLHIQSITMSFVGLEYDVWNEEKIVKGVIYPEEITITFIENEIGIVRNYLTHWLNQVVYVSSITGEWIFKDDQISAKKNAIIIPQMKIGTPSPGWIQITGIKYKQLGSLTLAHSDGDPMLLECTFAIDNLWWKVLV